MHDSETYAALSCQTAVDVPLQQTFNLYVLMLATPQHITVHECQCVSKLQGLQPFYIPHTDFDSR